MKISLSTVGFSAATIGLLAVGLGIGSATAEVPAESATSVQVAAPSSTNASGDTYGTIGEAVEPDLIGVITTSGKEAYVWNSELKAAVGHPSLFKSPEEALAWQEEFGRFNTTIPAYALDGKTVVGEFVIVGGDEQKKLLEAK